MNSATPNFTVRFYCLLKQFNILLLIGFWSFSSLFQPKLDFHAFLISRFTCFHRFLTHRCCVSTCESLRSLAHSTESREFFRVNQSTLRAFLKLDNLSSSTGMAITDATQVAVTDATHTAITHLILCGFDWDEKRKTHFKTHFFFNFGN